MHPELRHKTTLLGTLLLAISALGVVFGDIGTSPLYAINEIFFGLAKVSVNYTNVIGSISLVIWALSIIISIKYVIFVMGASNDGEGGVFALLGLLKKNNSKIVIAICSILLLSAGLLFGEGIITPAISVLSAVEGLKVITATFNPYILPLTVIILAGLFLVQAGGTHKIGKIFGPITTIWFISIAVLGIVNIIKEPEILNALNPINAFLFIRTLSPLRTLEVLGSVMLVITGGEALYADMGHFGKLPIRIGWYVIVFPALLLQYLGQGAYLLTGQKVIEGSIFYSMVPHMLIIPAVILATCATVIASQALITGVFSLASQAITLGLMPLLRVDHTHEKHEGQVYVPFANWALFICCIILVLTFKTSSNLASAYGLSVAGVMTITSLSMIALTQKVWKWKKSKTILIFGSFLVIDLTLLAANSLKFFQGGYIPLTTGLVIFTFMSTWQWGRQKTIEAYNRVETLTVSEFIEKRKINKSLFQRSTVIFSRKPIRSTQDTIPIVLQNFWDKYLASPKNLIFFTLVAEKHPYQHHEKYELIHLNHSETEGEIISVIAHYGYMESMNAEQLLEELAKDKRLPISDNPQDWIIEFGHERFIVSPTMPLISKIRFTLYSLLKKIVIPGYHHLGLKNNLQLFIEVFPEYIK